jgi:ATP-dependent Clp endopeptidase proteolytic subunit ClpP
METHIYIYSQIGQGGVTAESIRKKLVNAGEEITVHINSPGGEVYEGYTIYNILRNSGKKVNVVIEGLCASIATLIACAGDTIVMNPTAEFMIHNPMVGIEGDSEDLRKVADQLDQIKKTIIAAYKRKTNKSEEELWDLMNKETFFTADMAKEFGFVDDVQQALKVVAYLDIKKFKNDIPMDQKILNAFTDLSNKFDSFFKSKPKNLDMTLQDGTALFVETESETDLKEKAAFIVTPEGNQQAPDGEHTLADGKVIVVAGGIIKEVKEPEAPAEPTIEDLKKQVEDLTNQLTAKNTEIENSKKETETIKAELETQKVQVEEVKNEFEKIRNTVLGNPKDPKKQFLPKVEGKIDNDLLTGLVNKIKQKAN